MALVGLKGGGFVTRKRLEEIGKTPDDVKRMTPDEQAQMMGWQAPPNDQKPSNDNFSVEENQKIETAVNQLRAMSPEKQQEAFKQTDDIMRNRIQGALDARSKIERNVNATYPEMSRFTPEKMPEKYQRSSYWREAQAKVEQKQREFQLWKETQRRLKL